jgi:hypothetical protein
MILLGASVSLHGVTVLLNPSLPSCGWLLIGLHHPLHHALHPDRWSTVVLTFFHLLRPSNLPGFVLEGSAVIGWYKSLLRQLMLRCLNPRSMRRRGLILMPRCLSPRCLVRCLMPCILMLGCRSRATNLLEHFFLGLGFLSLQEGALRMNMPT